MLVARELEFLKKSAAREILRGIGFKEEGWSPSIGVSGGIGSDGENARIDFASSVKRTCLLHLAVRKSVKQLLYE
jgi:hypothetical protein